ncbi:hypothetical protein [Burkholderia vietnamiensis]|uniref:hypothetical protein n=1 Tax=Burkholderia vietnamiensis TaxID=60552 RepID=UPI001BA27555|nr:hypothetical protein [Burkholderia vietnamiensis]MBR8284599.1 hypothetical protein [Burkholderia vietnamiensis]
MKIDNEELHAVIAVSTDTRPDAAPRYVAIGGEYKVVPKERLRAAGWRVTKTMPPVTQGVPDTWVDLETGEILTKTEARKRDIKLPVIRSASGKALALGERLAACAPRERPFVCYLLKMRNQRGGLVGSLDTILDLWITRECPGVRSTDKARKRKQLRSIIERRKLMANDVTMAKDLALFNPNITKQEMIEEAVKLCALRHLPAKSSTSGVPDVSL